MILQKVKLLLHRGVRLNSPRAEPAPELVPEHVAAVSICQVGIHYREASLHTASHLCPFPTELLQVFESSLKHLNASAGSH